MKKSILQISMASLLLFRTTIGAFGIETTKCECGDHATGVTLYTVTGLNADCCKGSVHPGSIGYLNTYIQQANGLWQLDTSTQMAAQAAQDNCCRDKNT